jgi:hypothetical protein
MYPDPESWIQGVKKHRIPDPVPQHWAQLKSGPIKKKSGNF